MRLSQSTFGLSLVLISALLPGYASASPQDGVDFLLENQSLDGSHGSVSLRDTAAATQALSLVSGQLSGTSPEAIFAASARPGDLDGQAYRLITLGSVGEGDSDGGARLRDLQGEDGGYSLYPGYESGVLETALALRALAISGQGDLGSMADAAAFLEANQGEGGGFGHHYNDPSVTVTAEALLAFGRVDQLLDVGLAMEGAAAWLVAAQGEDGSFGQGSLPLLDSALGTLALLSYGGATPEIDLAIASGIAYLESTQQVDGSWDSDPYTTALALQVIGGQRPNLTLLDVSLAGAEGAAPVEGEALTLSLTVKNDGRLGTRVPAAVTVHRVLADGATLQLLGELELGELEAGATETLTLEWLATGIAGDVYLKTSLDVEERIEEGDEADNVLYSGVYLIPRVDLAITDADIRLLPEDAGLQEEVQVTATVHNRGGTLAEDFTVAMYQGSPSEGGVLLHSEVLTLDPLTSTEVVFQDLFPKGEYEVVVLVDSEDVIRESLENNNRAMGSFNVSERYDFAGSFERIWASPSEVVEPGAVNISAVFFNLREDTAEDVVVQCYVYNPDLHDTIEDRIPFDEPQIIDSLPGDGSATINCTLETEGLSGRNYVYAVADPEDAFPEVREDNNEAIVTVVTYRQPNLMGESISSSSSVYEGTSVSITGRFKNTGGVTLQQVPVAIYIGDPGAGGTRLAPDQIIATVNPDASVNATALSWDTTGWDAGAYSVYAVADPDGLLTEYDEADNAASKTITVVPRSDLQIIPEDIVFSNPSPEEGDSLTITATVRNVVSTTASGTFYIRMYDGDPAAGGTLLVEQSRSSLSGNQSVDVVFDFLTSDAVGDHPIYVTVDEEEVINERFRQNNYANRLLTIASSSRPDPSLVAGDVVVSPGRGAVPGEDLTLTATVRNLRNRDASDVVLRLYGGDPRGGALPAADDITLDIPGLSDVTVPVIWTTPSILLTTDLYLVVDPDGLLAETNETNNEVVIPYKSRQQSGTEPRNLAASVDYRDVTLTWDSPNLGTPQAYALYRGETLLNPPEAMDPGTPDADSTYRAGYEPDKAFDGNTSTYWLSSSHSSPWWLSMTLSEPTLLTEMEIYWQSSYRGVNYEIQGFNGSGWETLASVVSNTANEVVTPLTSYLLTDQYRIYVTFSSSSSYSGIREVFLTGRDGLIDRNYVDVDVLEGSYTYVATAIAANTYESPDSNGAEVNLDGPPPPGDLVGTPSFSRVDLSWSEVSDPGFVSYLVYRDGALLNGDGPLDQADFSATASTSYNSTYVPEKAIDGDSSTYWFNQSQQFPATYTVDLGAQRIVSSVDILWQSSYRGIDYDLQGWDGDEWVTLLEVVGNADNTVTHPVNRPFQTDQVRLVMTKSNSSSYVGIHEFNVDAYAPLLDTSYADTHLFAQPYLYGLGTLNRLGEVGALSLAEVTVPDALPPAALNLSPSQNQMAMTWPDVNNDTLMSYVVYRGDLPIQETTPRQGVADTVATATSTRNDSYPPENAIDGNSSSYWQSASSTAYPNDFEITFPSPQVIQGIEVDWHTTYYCIDYDLDGHNGKEWQTLLSVRENGDYLTRDSFDSFASERFRIRCTLRNHSSYLLIYELRLLGFEALTDRAFTDIDVPTDDYTWGVSMINQVGEESIRRDADDSLFLAPPLGFSAAVDRDNVDLTWSIDGSAPVVGYRLFRGERLLASPNYELDLGDGVVTATASSIYSASYPPDLGVDGKDNTQWIGLTGATTWWYELSLPSPQELMGVSIDWSGSREATDYVIQYWDGAQWLAILSREGSTAGFSRLPFEDAITADRIRVLITDANSTNAPGIVEMFLHGAAPLADTAYTDLDLPSGDHTYTLYSVDPFGGLSEPRIASATIGGGLSAPTLTDATPSGAGVDLAWTASPSGGVLGYWVYRDGIRVGEEDDRAEIGTAIASDVYSTSSSYQASNANDGNTSSRWRSSQSGPWTFELAWPDTHKFDRITHQWGSSTYPTHYRIETWTGSEWHLELEVEGNTSSTRTDYIENMLTSTRVRVNILESSSTYVDLYEISAIEPDLRDDLSFRDSVTINRLYSYCVRAVGEDVLSPCSNILSAEVHETDAPAQVAGGRVRSYSRTNITLEWDPNTEYDIFGYNIYYDGSDTPLNSVPIKSTSYSHSNVIVPEILTYDYVVRALDINDNIGPPSETIRFAPEPLDPPPGFEALKSYASVELSWDTQTDPLFASYSVYRNGEVLAQALTAKAYTDERPGEGTWTYQVAAMDRFNRVGPLSEGIEVEMTDMDLVVSDPSIFFLPQVPSALYNVKLHVSVRNDGGQDTPESIVHFYDGEPEEGGVLIAEVTLPALEAGALGVVEHTWELEGQAGEHWIVAVVDPEDDIAEFAEDNNVARKSLRVTEVPELQVTVNSVNGDNFPEVVMKVDILDPSGEDVAGLDERSIFAFEDGVVQSPIQVVENAGESASEPIVDVVFVVDSSGSMDAEWNTVPNLIERFTEELFVRGINLQSEVFSLGSASHGYPGTTDGLFNGQPHTVGSEDYGPSVTWHCSEYGWRPGSVSIVIPMGDENAYQGSGQNASDLQTIAEGIASCSENEVLVFPLWGDGSSQSVIDEMEALAAGTDAAAFHYLEINRILDFMTLSVLNRVARYEVTYSTNNPIRDGSERFVELGASYRGAEGLGDGTYIAPEDDILDLVALSIETQPGTPVLGEDAQIIALLRNESALTLDSVPAQILLEQEGRGAITLGGVQDVGPLAPGESAEVRAPWQGMPGAWTLSLIADPLGEIAERSEDNNIVSKSLRIPGVVGYELAVYGDEIDINSRRPMRGDRLTVDAVVHNFGLEATGVLVQLYDGAPARGGRQIGGDVIIPYFNESSSEEVRFEWDTSDMSSLDDPRTLHLMVDPFNRFDEISEANNIALKVVDLEVPPFDITVRSESQSYGANANATFTATVVNHSTGSFMGDVRFDVEGALLGEDGIVAGTATINELVGNPFPAWAYALTVRAPADTASRGESLLSLGVDFGDVLSRLGASGNFDPESIRVAQHDPTSLRPLATFPARFMRGPEGENVGKVVFETLPLPSFSGAERVYRVYFDVIDAAHGPLGTLPPADGLIAVADENGIIRYSRRGADGVMSALNDVADRPQRVRSLTIADLNGDGLDDIITADYVRSVVLYAAKADGTFPAEGELIYQGSSSGDVRYLEAGDIDNDGDIDLLWCLSSTPEILRNQGDGSFVIESMSSAGTTAYTGQLVDLDADGDLDLTLGLNGGRFSWYENQGDGTFAELVQLFQISGNAPYGLAVGDFDGDGYLDLVFNDGSSGNAYLAKGLGSGTFAAPVRNASGDSPGYARMDSLDFNNDGALDLLLLPAGSSSTPVELRPGTGSGTFGLATTLTGFTNAAYGAAASGRLEVGVQAISSPFENAHPEVEVSVNWNTGVTRAGSFEVVGQLLEGGSDERGTDSDDFSIGAIRGLLAEVDTDWPEYVPGERALISAYLQNITANDAVTPTEGLISVYDPDGVEVLSDLYTLSEMEPGEEARWVVEQDLYNALPGTYHVLLQGLSDGTELGLAESFFEVLPLDALEGTLTVDPGQVLEGEGVLLAYGVRNRGTSPVAGLPIFLRVQDGDSGEIQETYDYNVSLDPDEQTTGDTLQGTEALGLGTFDVLLGAVLDGEEIILAQGRFIVINITGTLEASPAVAEGGIESVDLDWGVHNRGDVILEDLDLAIIVSLDGEEARTSLSPWTLTLEPQEEITGQEIVDTLDLGIGLYDAALVNSREEGSITLATATFTVADTIAPISTLTASGVVVAGEDGTLYAPYETRYVIEGSDNFSGLADIRYTLAAGAEVLYSVPIQFTVDGLKTIQWYATDLAGVAEAPQSYNVVVDGSDPVITLDSLSEEGCVGDEVPLTFTVEDLSPTEIVATLDGDPFESGTIVSEVGSHTLVVTATDILGNTSQETFTLEVTDDPCACAPESATSDADGDGVASCEGDCDDSDPDIYPGAPEACDGVDNDCDGTIDNDGDGDGFTTCEDCDDENADINPNATELENGLDDDCDGSVDEALCVTDTDGDGFTGLGGDCDLEDASIHPGANEAPGGAPDDIDNDCDGVVDEGTTRADDDGDGYSEEQGDCDDNNPLMSPDVPEDEGSFFYTDGIDNNCDGVIDDGSVADGDSDGYLPAGGDCDDDDASVYPGAPEDGGAGTGIADGKDNNCDGRLDEGTNIRDDDFDGYSEEEGDCDDNNFAISPEAVEAFDGIDEDCDGGVDEGTRPCDSDGDGFMETEGDCDDSDADINPNGVEVCDSEDNDCDGEIDEGEVCRVDNDGDGYSGEEGDCDDGDPDINPDALEICDGEDNDCDGEVDEGEVCRVDSDGDGFSPDDGDCDDQDAGVNPDALEICDGIDQDCDGGFDEDLPLNPYLPDSDGDGYGDATGTAIERCGPEEGEVADNTDCDDSEAGVNPGIEVDDCDELDNDCDGEVDEDCDIIPDDTPTSGSATPPGGSDPDCGCTSAQSEAGSYLGLLLMGLLGLGVRRRWV